MALRKRINVIDKSQIRTGQVLEIQYTDREGKSSKDLILVIDPKATAVANTGAGPTGVGQGRVGKLHAIKLENLLERQLYELIKEVRNIKKEGGLAIRRQYEDSIYSKGVRNYRTYSLENIDRVSRVTLGQPTTQTNKITIGSSVLYGVVHGEHVELSDNEYDAFGEELQRVNGKIYFEGSKIEPVIMELIGIQTIYEGSIIQESWEPDPSLVSSLARVGGKLAGWWNESYRDGSKVALENLRGEWARADVGKNGTIGEAFMKMIGNDLDFIKDNWFEYEGYSKEYVFGELMNQRGFTDDDSPTEELLDFNEAGHDQVFPQDRLGSSAPRGVLAQAEDAFNSLRRKHLIKLMQSNPGIYFAGNGHIDILKTEGYR